ncbi:ABC transporter ATP-binding protein [Brooklawnia cerclae]|uniref:Nickel import system ATP-binding protein NikD n=1 Tax=Brooklawnia cerclae TaxID=349934 RepID=A0ABX0SME1_9ACTN|nr:ABC transporter ATP-binding protein [Brooklawnia cerclae]NIH57907.1 oligopeptide/dipeptide ABC transporter ATP-binding protein [Brooklawnia cerclae]
MSTEPKRAEPDEAAVTPSLELRDLHVSFATDEGRLTAVEGVDLTVSAGQTLGLVGESGCGKSVTARAVMRLLDERNTDYSGQVLFHGTDLLGLPPKQMRRYRGAAISMIFQDPMTSLDPVFTIGNQLGESLKLHRGLSSREARTAAGDLLTRTGIPDASRRLDDYPHQLSGGMRQRVMIAMALAAHPEVLIADEPTTALDVTTQAQILDLLAELQQDLGMALIFISHDLSVVREICDRVAIMYLGQVIEEGPTGQIMEAPRHPYTRGLMASVPAMDRDRHEHRLAVIPGRVPGLAAKPDGCYFRPRCPIATQVCLTRPGVRAVSSDARVRCWHADHPAESTTTAGEGTR